MYQKRAAWRASAVMLTWIMVAMMTKLPYHSHPIQGSTMKYASYEMLELYQPWNGFLKSTELVLVYGKRCMCMYAWYLFGYPCGGGYYSDAFRTSIIIMIRHVWALWIDVSAKANHNHRDSRGCFLGDIQQNANHFGHHRVAACTHVCCFDDWWSRHYARLH